MTLLVYGSGKQPESWFVEQSKPAGFSRIYYITGGDITYKDEHQEKKLEIDKLYIFPSHKEYSIRHSKRDTLCCLWFHVDLFPNIVKDIIEVPVILGSSIYYLLAALHWQLVTSQGKSSYFLALVCALTEYFYEKKYISLPDEAMEDILAYINSKYKEKITVEQISGHFHYTVEHFIRMFQKKTGVTPYQYLTSCKMREAVKLLLQGTAVGEVAYLVGYADLKTFSHAFKQKFEIAPSQYMKYYTNIQLKP